MENIDYTSSQSYRPVQLAQVSGQLYQRHITGQIWKFNGPYINPRWSLISDDDNLVSLTASDKYLYKLTAAGYLYRYDGNGSSWSLVRNVGSQVKDAIASNQHMYYIMGNGSYTTGINMDAADSNVPAIRDYNDLLGDLDEQKARTAAQEAEVTRLKGVKEADDKVIAQLQSDFRGAEGRVATLTTELQAAKDEAARAEKENQAKLNKIQKDLADAEAGEKKLSEALDEEKKKEHEQWKKAQEHDAADNKALTTAQEALEQNQADNTALKAKIDGLTKQLAEKAEEIKKLEDTVAETLKKKELAEAELKKHLTDDEGDDLIISGLERVIQGLKKEVEGREILLGVLRKQLAGKEGGHESL